MPSKTEKAKNASKSHKKKKTKTFEEREQESSQLDNLFLTLREDLIEGHKEELRRKKRKRSANKNKQRKHKEGKRSRAFIEIEETTPTSGSLLQLSQVDSSDLTVDEQAELALKRTANNMAGDERPSAAKNDLSVDSQASEAGGGGDVASKKELKGLAGADREQDTALKNALKETVVEESLQKAEGAANGEGGPERGNPEKYKTDSYTNKAAKRLLEEAEQEKTLKKLEGGAATGGSSTSSGRHTGAIVDSKKDSAIKKLLEESDTEESLKKAEKNVDTSKEGTEEKSDDGALVQMHAKAPVSRTLVQLTAQVSA